MVDDLFYPLPCPKLGLAVIINNLDLEQEPTRKDVSCMAEVLRDIGFDVEIHRNLSSQGMNQVKRKMTEERKHRDTNCFLMLVISHGTVDNFLQDKDGQKTWNIESLVTEVCDVQSLVGKPKLFFIEACRGKENNFSVQMMTKSSKPPATSHNISLPSKQDVFVGFATVPGFVSFTSMLGSPYLQSLSSLLSSHHPTVDLGDIHLLVKRKLASMKLGTEGARQGAEERSSLLSKLLFSKYSGNHRGTIKEDFASPLSKALSSLSLSSQTPSRPSLSPLSSLSLSSQTPSKPSPVSSISIPISRSPITVARADARTEREMKTLSMDTQPSTSPPSLSLSPPTRPVSLLLSSDRLRRPARSAFLGTPSVSAYSRPSSIAESSFRMPSVIESPIKMTSVPNSPLKTTFVPISPLKTTPVPSSPLKMTPVPSIFRTPSTTTHVIEVASSDVEGGLRSLLSKVQEVYGGQGKVKVKEGREKKNYSFKYLGPDKAACLLEGALASVRELQGKSDLWRFTQRLEVSSVSQTTG